MANENETVEQVCEQLVAKTEYFIREYDRGLGILRSENFSKRLIAAHKRELAEKDEDIEILKWKVENYASVVEVKGKEIAMRDALIKELAYALNLSARPCWSDDCSHCNLGHGECEEKRFRELIVKAREVTNG